MTRYETIFITKPDMDEEVRKNISEKLKTVVAEHAGAVHHCENAGKQKLAFEVQGNVKGVFHYIGFEGNGEVVKELERNLRLNESVIKYQSFRVDGDFRPQLVFVEKVVRPYVGRGRPRFGGSEFGRDDEFDPAMDDGASDVSRDGGHEGRGPAASRDSEERE